VVRRLLVLLSVLTLAFPMAASAQDPSGADRFERSQIQGTVDPQILPAGLDDSTLVNVMVQLNGDPVAVHQAQSRAKLSKAEKDAIKADLKAQQDSIKDDIAARGGQVLSQLQSAYNGMRVRIARSDAASLATLPNVIAVRGLQVQTIENAVAIPYIGAPAVWDDGGFKGDNIKIAVIDTGIDYTHANFGGPGTVKAFAQADRGDTRADRTGFFGPDAPKVKGGFDFVGDAYDASSDDPKLTVPHPDPNPLDCNGHGSHTSGSAAGFGVTEDGATYTGPYDETTHSGAFRIGPGVAPLADLYALRVFGCAGSTDVTVDAIDWAVDHDMDVINMSLGSPFGRSDDPSAEASTNAAEAGVIVVASAGNEGPSQYITGSPASATGAISVAAVDSTESFPGVSLDLGAAGTIQALNANDATIAPATLPVVVLKDDPATTDENEALGCSVEAFEKAGVTGALAVSVRGTCARVARAIFGQQAGAAAVAMINTDAGFPPFEGPITSNPDTGEPFTVTIPFLGVKGVLGAAATDDPDKLVAAASATLAEADITNPGFRGFASFSSGGPRNGDSWLKPDISAPGVSIQSTLVGSGNEGTRISGTSMASPMVAGTAALAREAHPGWSVEQIKAAIVNTGDPAKVANLRVSRGGTGLVQPAGATATQVTAVGDAGTATLNFGFAELGANFSGAKTVTLTNHAASARTYSVSAAAAGGVPASTALSATSVTVPGGGTASVNVTLSVPAASVGNSSAFREAVGIVTFTSAGAPTLRVPYYLVPRALSDVTAAFDKPLDRATSARANVLLANAGVIAGNADFYAWGLEDGDDVDEAALGGSGYDVRAIGVQSFDSGVAGEKLIVFAVNAHDRFSNAAVNDYEIYLDTDQDGTDDYAVVGIDFGAFTTGSFDGRLGSFVIDLATGDASVFFLADAPSDSSTVLLPFLTRQTDISASQPSFSYTAASFSLEGAGVDEVEGTAKYNAYSPSISQGQFATVAPGRSTKVAVTVNNAEWAKTPALGVMVVVVDNASGANEARLLSVE
jgi:minor extracellular serine protease Vpr